MRVAELHLAAPAAVLGALELFYADVLELTRLRVDATVAAGPSRLSWRAADRDRQPFYHFALLVPGPRFDAAHAWLAERVELLALDGDPVVAFPDWNARALYFHDPAGSIVEFIAHRGIEGEGPADGPFTPRELLGVSEMGIVVDDKRSAAEALHTTMGIDLWSGRADAASLDDPHRLAFLGRKAHTLILAAPGRGWLPTGRPAETHPAYIVLAGAAGGGSVTLADGIVVRAAQKHIKSTS